MLQAILLWPGLGRAQVIWSAATTIVTDTDVLTNGSLLYAYDWANNNETVNGVNFAGSSSSSGAPNMGITVSTGSVNNTTTAFGSTASAPFTNLPAAYQGILKGGDWASAGNATFTVTLEGLTAGNAYAVQLWVNDDRSGESTRTETMNGSNSVLLAYNAIQSAGGVGQYVIGIFRASSTSQTFTMLGAASTQVNALQVRNVTGTGFTVTPGGGTPSALWVHFGTNGLLQYHSDPLGNRLPDFSFAGYMGGGVALPVVPIAETISPVAGDNTANIQNAINAVSALTPNANGFRGAVLLNPGTYTIAGTLSISASGVVLRGSGDNTNTGTILLVTGLSRNVFTVGGSGSWSQTGPTYTISDPYVPLGATNFHIAANPIVWGTNVTIAGDTDVFTNGTLLYAYDWANSNATVNGIAFAGASGAAVSTNVSVSGIGSYYAGYSSSSAPFSSLSSEYRSILTGGEYGGAVTATVTLNNLTSGRVYAVQVWVSDPRGGGTAGRTETVSGLNQVTLAYNVPPATGGVGQYSIGVFTAIGNSQTFSLTTTGTGSTQINALLVSDVTGTDYQPVNPSTNYAALAFGVGDTIVVQRPQTQSWIDAINMNTLTNPWTPGAGLQLERQVVAISSNQVTVDAPLCNPIESVWTTGEVYQVTDSARLQYDGVENLCAMGQLADYPSNILNGCFLVYQNLKNSWAHDLFMAGWGNAISMNPGSKWCTAQDCQYVLPATSSADDAPAAYTVGDGVGYCLYQRCTSDGGYYHIMVTQAGSAGPDVFLNFTSTGTHYNGGPHQRWAAGALHDNINMGADTEGGYTPYLAINNRGNDGSGQGWAAGFSVMYNCQVPQFQLEEPDTTTNQYNWTIGGIGGVDDYSDLGIYDTLGVIVSPHSLYLEQLKERLGPAAVQNIGYPVFTMSVAPTNGPVVAGDTAAFTVNVAATNYFSDTVALSVTGLPTGTVASFNTNLIAGSGSATLTVSTAPSLATNNYPVIVVAVDGNLTNSATLNLAVTAPLPPTLNGAGTYNGRSATLSFSFSGPAGQSYRVLAATNLVTPLTNWLVLTNGIFSPGSTNFSDSATNGAERFYRIASP